MSDDGSIPLHYLAAAQTGSGNNILIQIFLIVFLIFLNAFFASSEIALLTVHDAKLKKQAENGDKKSAILLKIVENPSKFLSTIQVGVTLAGLLNSAVASSSFADIITSALVRNWDFAARNSSLINTINIVLITIILSFFTLVFGELVPKRYAMRNSEKMAKMSIKPLRFTGAVFSPFIKVVTLSVNAVLRIIGIDPTEDDNNVTKEAILLAVTEGKERGIIGNEESEMIRNVFKFDDKNANDIMTHRTEIAAVSIDDSFEHIVDLAANERYSRFPVYQTNLDNIIGIIHIKDLFKVTSETFDLRSMMRAPTIVPESQKIDDIFDVLKENNTHMAVVVDEYGGTSGIVTMEDILEELVGNIRDEYDSEEEEENTLNKIADNKYVVDGLIEIDIINEDLNLSLPTDEYDTISGLVIGLIGEIPEEDEHPEVAYENCIFKVLKSNEKIIEEVEITVTEKSQDSSQNDKGDESDED